MVLFAKSDSESPLFFRLVILQNSYLVDNEFLTVFCSFVATWLSDFTPQWGKAWNCSDLSDCTTFSPYKKIPSTRCHYWVLQKKKC